MTSADGKSEAGTRNAPTVLVVDDDSHVRQFLRAALEPRFVVIEARNGRDALKIFSAMPARPSLVVVDVVMPVMGGLEVIAKLRQLGVKTPVIATTCRSAAQDDLLDVAMKLGGDERIVKPFTAEAIVGVADRLLAA